MSKKPLSPPPVLPTPVMSPLTLGPRAAFGPESKIRCTLPSWAGEEKLWMGWGRLCPAGGSTPHTHLGIFQHPHPTAPAPAGGKAQLLGF